MDETRPLNYFNYYTEVEDTFVRRRGAHMMVSPLDWALIEAWKEAKIPLHIVLRGIEQSFDGWEAKPNRYRRVNSIFYCQQAVETCYAEYRASLVGAAEEDEEVENGEDDAALTAAPTNGDAAVEEDASPFPRARVEAFLRRVGVELEDARREATAIKLPELEEAIGRVVERLTGIIASLDDSARMDAEGLERDLTSLEEILTSALVEHAPEEVVATARDEAKSQLKGYRKQMEKEFYQQTFDKFVARRLREAYRIPRLSLFFME